MSTQMALFLSGVFCLILTSFAQETCRLDAAMTLFNEDIKQMSHVLFRGSQMHIVSLDLNNPKNLIKTYDITEFWRSWSGEKVTRTMFLYEKNNSAIIIGDSETTHLVRFNEKFEVDAGSYQSWSNDSLQDFAVDGVSPSQGIFVSNYQPGYVCPFRVSLQKTHCELMSIDLTKSDGGFRKGGERHKKNPNLKWWLDNFYQGNLKLIGIFKTGRVSYCTLGLFHCNAHKTAWEYEESFVAFIEHDSQTWHCAGKFSRRNIEDCTKLSQYNLTDKTLFGCNGKEDGLTSTTLSSKIGKLTFGSTAQNETEITIGFEKKKKTNWKMWALFATLIIVIIAASYFGVSLRNKQDSHKYKLLKKKNKKTKISSKVKPRKAKDLKLVKSSSKFKPRKAKNLKLFGSSG